MISITKEFNFAAAHSLTFHGGKCRRLHGHTYILQVTVSGPLNKNDLLMDFGDLKDIVNRWIIQVLDHSHLNDFLENPTAENLCLWIAEILKDRLKVEVSESRLLNLEMVRLWETPTSFATWTEDQ